MLRQADKGKTILEACRENNISEQTFHRWKREFWMIDVNQARRMKELEKEDITGFKYRGVIDIAHVLKTLHYYSIDIESSNPSARETAFIT